MHSTSAFKPPSASRTTRDEAVHFPIYGYNSKEAVWATPQQPGLIEPNKDLRKRGLSKDEPTAKPTFAAPGARVSTGTHSHPASMFAWRPCPPDAMLNRRSVSTGTHTHLASMFRSAPIFARWSYFDRCPVSTDTMPT